ncbi:hypothetical protein CHUAL_006492 [Chamberlinius hualienensis]
MAIAVLLVFSSVIMMTLTETVPNCQNYTTYDTIQDLIDGVDICTYATDKFTPDCVAASCLEQLNNQSLCPFDADGQLDINNVNAIVRAVNNCFKQPSICGVPIDPIPYPPTILNVSQLLQGTTLDGVCKTINSDENFVRNVSNTVISVLDTQDPQSPLTLSINVSNLDYGHFFECNLSSDELTKLLNHSIAFKLTNLTFDVNFQITTYTVANISSSNIEPNVAAAVTLAATKISDFNFGTMNPLLDIASNVFASLLSSYSQSSPLPKDFGKFIAAIIDNAFIWAKRQCRNN